MMTDLFTENKAAIVTSNRILYTASSFARNSLLHLQEIGQTLGSDRASMMDASNNGWKSHLERNNQTTSSESWCRRGNVRYKRRQLGGRDGN